MQFLIGDDIEVEAGAYRGCTEKVVKVTKIQMEVLMESGVRHPLMEPVAGSIRRVKQDNARLVNREPKAICSSSSGYRYIVVKRSSICYSTGVA